MAEDLLAGFYDGTNCWNISRSMFMGPGSWSSCSGLNDIRISELQTELLGLKAGSGTESNSGVSDGSIVIQDIPKAQSSDSASGGGSILMDSSIQIIGGFGLSSSPTSEWNQTFLSQDIGRDHEGCFDSMIEKDMDCPKLNFGQGNKFWNPKGLPCVEEDYFTNTFKPSDHIPADQRQTLNSFPCSDNHYFACPALSETLPFESTLDGCSSKMLQSLHDTHAKPQNSFPSCKPTKSCFSTANFVNTSCDAFSTPWLTHPANSKPSMIKQNSNSSRFSCNSPLWIEPLASLTDIQADQFFASSTTQSIVSRIEEKRAFTQNFSSAKGREDVNDSGPVVKKSESDEPLFKRPRIQTPSPLPTFKVRKDKMGDRITALQQLVSPFGKTDTASVLHEAIEYIKYLHDQLSVLSTPYMRTGQQFQPQQGKDKRKNPEGPRQDLKNRGLCLVPISRTYPVANVATPDYWTPSLGRILR